MNFDHPFIIFGFSESTLSNNSTNSFEVPKSINNKKKTATHQLPALEHLNMNQTLKSLKHRTYSRKTHLKPEDDILYQWRLARKMELASQPMVGQQFFQTRLSEYKSKPLRENGKQTFDIENTNDNLAKHGHVENNSVSLLNADVLPVTKDKSKHQLYECKPNCCDLPCDNKLKCCRVNHQQYCSCCCCVLSFKSSVNAVNNNHSTKHQVCQTESNKPPIDETHEDLQSLSSEIIYSKDELTPIHREDNKGGLKNSIPILQQVSVKSSQ